MLLSERSAKLRFLDFTNRCALSLLLISAFRAPDSMPGLQPAVMWLKVFIRFGVMSGVGIALLISWRQVLQSRTLFWYAPFFLFCGWGVISTLWSPLKSESLGQAISLTTLVVVSVAVSVIQRDQRDAIRLLRWMLINLWLICLFLLLTGLLIPSTGHLTRAGQGLGHSTNSGATASLALVLLVLSNLLWKMTWARSLLLPGLIVFGVVAIVSANRFSMLIAALILPTVILLYGNRQLIATSLIGIACLGTLFPIVDPKFELVGFATEVFNRGQSTDEIGSLSGRQLMWEVMWKSYLDSPWIGHGFFVSSAGGELVVWYLFDELLPVNWTAHNVWLQALVSTGLVGLVLFIAAVSPPFLYLSAKFLRGIRWTATETFCGVVVVWYLLWSLLNESILGPLQPESVFFFVVFGTLIASHARHFATNQLPRLRESTSMVNGQISDFADGVSSR